MASALQFDVDQCSISAHALFFCDPRKPTRSCETRWGLEDAFMQLQRRGQSLPTASCMPYRPDFTGDQPAAALCKGSCNTPSAYASQGQFSQAQRIATV
jgi:hypothetical protein